jgi:hypothetical protein
MSGAAMRVLVPVLVLVGLLTGCSKKPAPASSSKPAQAEKAAKEVQTTPSKKAEPQLFGFNVLSVQKELCCSDSPGKLVPTGSLAVEGLTNDNWRFALSCFDNYVIFKSHSGYTSRRPTRDEWFELHTASIEHQDHGDAMTIYIFQDNDWKKMANCMILNRIERANDVAQIRVTSSEFREWKAGSGYEVEAWSADEVYRLACVQGAQSPCVSVAPATYRGVRDGSELRLCDQDLNLICTYRIVGERGRR